MTMATQPSVERDFVTIVSGLPRSGTSMMLQMLAAGGLPVLTDGVRVADFDNPHGYLEWEPVKSLSRDATWVASAVGKGVKAIYWFLYDFPPEYRYRVVFMRRDLDEVLASQTAMLKRRGTLDPAQDDIRMRQLFEQELREIDAWLACQAEFQRLYVDYREVLRTPHEQAERVNAFLGCGLNIDAMAAVVAPSLYRSRGNR